MIGPRTHLTHDALLYRGGAEFLAATVPFLRDGLDQHHACVVAVQRHNAEPLRAALGRRAADVTFLDRDAWYRRPAVTVQGWKRLLDEALEEGRTQVRIIGEVRFGPAERHASWTRYESALNAVFADAPAWIICPYDVDAMPAAVLRDARRTHPELLTPVRAPSADYQRPEDLLAAMPEPVRATAGPPTLDLRFGPSATHLRERVRAAARHLPQASRDALIIVVGEVAANSLRHGRGPRRARLWLGPDGVVGEVTDHGSGPADPLTGYRPPAGATARGWGLWVAHQLCDALAIEHRDGLTRVRFALS
ncbi:MAG: sensor histidine kinase [Hamadaea sp.]|nr:sensor histidine kinase [Hamadaea sp.]